MIFYFLIYSRKSLAAGDFISTLMDGSKHYDIVCAVGKCFHETIIVSIENHDVPIKNSKKK